MIYNKVYQFLCQLNFEQYWDIFQAKGYDREDDIVFLDMEDLHHMGIMENDRIPMLEAASTYQLSESSDFTSWLEQCGLGHYLENFMANEYSSKDVLMHQELTEDFFSEIEMDVPGHRKRLQRAVGMLQKKMKICEPEEPVAFGYWAKPDAFPEARNDFLCLKASMQSTKDHSHSEQIEFMVDSGSDVITVREEILNALDLEPLGVVESRGVHASKEKQLYLAKLWIGNMNFDVEVMAESYDSIGNQVLRNFRHFIDSSRHIWLQDKKDIPSFNISMALNNNIDTNVKHHVDIMKTQLVESTSENLRSSEQSVRVPSQSEKNEEYNKDCVQKAPTIPGISSHRQDIDKD